MDELMGLIAKERNYPCLSNVVEDEYGGILRTSHAQNTEKDCGGFEALELRPETPDLNTHHEDPDFIWSEIYTWMLQIVDTCDLKRECIYYAMSYFQRFASTDKDAGTKRDCQLQSIAALYLTVKIHSEQSRAAASFLLELFQNLDGCCFTRACILEQEQKLLMELEWKLHPPTPQSFIYHFMLLLCSNEGSNAHLNSIFQVANYILDTLLPHPAVRSCKASSIAMASLRVALQGVKSTVVTAETIVAFQLKIEEAFEGILLEMNDELERISQLALVVFNNGASCDFTIMTLEEVRKNADEHCIVYEVHSI